VNPRYNAKQFCSRVRQRIAHYIIEPKPVTTLIQPVERFHSSQHASHRLAADNGSVSNPFTNFTYATNAKMGDEFVTLAQNFPGQSDVTFVHNEPQVPN
jgi:hypothetical protein